MENMSQRHVLVVDDDQHILTLIANMLPRELYRVSSALDGESAVSLLKQDEFDLIITDLIMPFMDGNALARTVRSDPNLRDIPVILITASRERNLLKTIFSSGSVFYLPKPFSSSSLLAIVRLALNNHLLRGAK